MVPRLTQSKTIKKVPKEIIKKTPKICVNGLARKVEMTYDQLRSEEKDIGDSKPDTAQINIEKLLQELKPAFL